MRKGKAADVRGAAGFVAESLTTAKEFRATGAIIVRANRSSTADVVAAARRAGAHMSLTTGSNPSVDAAIAACSGEWTPIHYPNAFVDADADLVTGGGSKLVARQKAHALVASGKDLIACCQYCPSLDLPEAQC